MSFSGGFAGPGGGPDVTNGGRKTVATVVTKSAVGGEVNIAATDFEAGIVFCDESSEFELVIAGSATDFISSLGGSTGSIYRLWVINNNSGAMRISRSNVTGKWSFCGDLATTGAGVFELQFIVAASDALVVIHTAHNQLR